MGADSFDSSSVEAECAGKEAERTGAVTGFAGEVAAVELQSFAAVVVVVVASVAAFVVVGASVAAFAVVGATFAASHLPFFFAFLLLFVRVLLVASFLQFLVLSSFFAPPRELYFLDFFFCCSLGVQKTINAIEKIRLMNLSSWVVIFLFFETYVFNKPKKLDFSIFRLSNFC